MSSSPSRCYYFISMKHEVDLALTRLQQGNRDGLTALYESTNRAVFAFVLPLISDYQLAEDIMQETYVHAYQSISSYQPGTNGFSWVFTIARNIALSMLEKRNREQHTDFDSQTESAGAVIEKPNFDSPTIDLAKGILPEDEQQILFLHTIGEYKHREIATLLNLPLGTVTWKYQEAIKKMKQALKERSHRHE